MSERPIYFDWQSAFREVNARGKNFSATQMCVLFAMSTYADTQTGRSIRPGYRRLRQGTSATNDTIRTAIAKGVELNVIKLVRPGNAGQADEYVLVRPREWRLSDTFPRSGNAENERTGNGDPRVPEIDGSRSAFPTPALRKSGTQLLTTYSTPTQENPAPEESGEGGVLVKPPKSAPYRDAYLAARLSEGVAAHYCIAPLPDEPEWMKFLIPEAS